MHNHSHARSHNHSHKEDQTGHGHSHAPAAYDRAFAVGIFLNLGFVVVEFSYGFIANSLALIADAGHNLSDVLSLILAWAAIWLTRRKPSKFRTYGFGRSTILASLINAVILLTAIGAIAWEAILRFSNPSTVQSSTILWVALVGIFINALTALLFMRGKDRDINIRGAYLHMVTDAAVSFGVVVAAIAIGQTGWLWIDPVISLIIVAVIAVGTFGILKESIEMAIDAVPRSIDLDDVKSYLKSLPDVVDVHDLHVWPLSTTSIALTAHVVKKMAGDGNWLQDAAAGLQEKFEIDHPTIQIEYGEDCRLASDEVI